MVGDSDDGGVVSGRLGSTRRVATPTKTRRRVEQ